MTARFPVAIATYLDAVDRGDVDASLAAFTDDATVVDEGRSYTGEAIRAWRSSAGHEFTYTNEFRSLRTIDDDHFVADFHLEGNFPGGVADLKYRFALRDDKIEHLEIAG
ncbi:MAG: nuclear transport factor 2 family protein [Ilumatobacteraceae bacterium]